MTQLACKDIVFHFNKKHLEDSTIPMWSLKTRGQTYYEKSVSCSLPWSTKETPDSSHTKGSIKIKNALLTIDYDNNAYITHLDSEQTPQINKPEPLRVGWTWRQDKQIKQLFEQLNVTHSVIKFISSGGCTSDWYVCDVFDPDVIVQIKLTLDHGEFRQFVSNEWQYKDYELMNDVDDDEEDELV